MGLVVLEGIAALSNTTGESKFRMVCFLKLLDAPAVQAKAAVKEIKARLATNFIAREKGEVSGALLSLQDARSEFCRL